MKYIDTLTNTVFESKEEVKGIGIVPLRNFLEIMTFDPYIEELDFLKGE